MRTVTRVLTLIVTSAALSLVAASSALAGAVLPATAKPHGWSLTRMADAIALFSTSGNNTAYYPKTPFQILYAGGSNTFTVRPGTSFFVPLFFVDDSPPVLGTWPTTHQEAVTYFFDSAQIGAQALEITVDGQTTPIGSAYLAGPVTTAPLLDGGGTHFIEPGAFLHPLTPGTHTVFISGGLFGDLVTAALGGPFTEAVTYTVTVGS